MTMPEGAKVIDLAKPLAPEDIREGDILFAPQLGHPVTITGLHPYKFGRWGYDAVRATTSDPEWSQVFFIFACYSCGQRRAFPGLDPADEWYGLTNRGAYRVFCSLPCLVDGLETDR